MPDYLEMLLDRAFETLPGELYNQYRTEVSERVGQSFLFYEFSLMEPKSWSHLRDLIYPNFVRYLKAKRRDPEYGSGVVVAIFDVERCYLLTGEDFLGVYREMERLDTVAFRKQVGEWLSQSRSGIHHHPVTVSNPRT